MPFFVFLKYFLYVFILSIAVCSSTQADPQSKSFSHWHINDNHISVTFTVASREVTRLPDYSLNADPDSVLSRHLSSTLQLSTRSLQLSSQQQRCVASTPKRLRSKPGYMQYQLQFDCDRTPAELFIVASSFMQAVPSHIHFAKFTIAEHPPFERLFTSRQIQQHIQLRETTNSALTNSNANETLLTYTLFGFEHILIGMDHIAFLLTLMLLSRRLRSILFIVTGFTLGHSITLGLATLGIANPDATLVEALIGFTIAIVAIENISVTTNNTTPIVLVSVIFLVLLSLVTALTGVGPPPYSILGLALFTFCFLRLSNSIDQAMAMRPLLSTCFGLIHGFGFASVLMEVGLPQQRIIPALIGFNIGVELGQIVIVLGLIGLGYLGRKLPHQQLLTECLCASLCGLGVFWFIQRGIAFT
jgi:hypothetical protein